MTQKRRDSKNRILRDRETQMPDGRYRYSYFDLDGKRKAVYSWKLEKTDRLPAGKKDSLSLREKIKEIDKRLALGESPDAAKTTVIELVERYILLKQGVRDTTRVGYKTVYNIVSKDPFGRKIIKDVKVSDAKLWLIQLQKNGRGYSSVHTIRGVLRPAFQMAVEDDILVKNPFEFQLATVVVNDQVTREAISRDQERKLLAFIKEDSHYHRYYEAIFILFKTGMRISEFCGLTVNDIDLKNKTINIDHQLLRLSNMEYHVSPTKTSCGTRVIPMSQEVYECFKVILNNRKKPKIEPVIDGYSGFLFLDKNNMPKVALHWENYF